MQEGKSFLYPKVGAREIRQKKRKKINFNLNLIYNYTKIHSKLIINFKVKCKTVKL